jgi:hypothetical protein
LEHQIYASQKKIYTTAGCDGWDICLPLSLLCVYIKVHFAM